MESEKYYIDPQTLTPTLFSQDTTTTDTTTLTTTTLNNTTIDLSVVIPAYNEEKRLPVMLDALFEYLNRNKTKFPCYEVLIIDDGSTDETRTNVAFDYSLTQIKSIGYSNIKVMTLVKNRGKGGAVKQGVLVSRGNFVLMVDADGATDVDDLTNLMKHVKDTDTDTERSSTLSKSVNDKYDVVIGSRAHLVSTSAVVKRSFIRNVLMRLFHLILACLTLPGVSSIKDTQCGFKLFTRHAAYSTFPNLHIEGWIFDVELLYQCWLNGLKVKEESVNWQEIEGSKMSLLSDSFKMAFDLLLIRLMYTLHLW